MGVYGEKILPHLVDLAMRGEEINSLREKTLAPARGRVLEIGFGTGLNARHYPKGIQELVLVDNNPGMSRLAHERLARAHLEARHEVHSGEALPFPDQSFDTIVVTFTLCSIGDVDSAVKELRRVLKPEGQLLFCEHNLADEERLRRIQRAITPVWKRVGGGCHLDRDAPALLERHGFALDELEKTQLSTVSGVFGTIRRGVAHRG